MQPVQLTNVFTLGDSTLENIWWFLNGDGTNMEHAKSVSAEGKLQTELGNRYKVVSLAYDGFTTTDVLEGNAVGNVFSSYGPKFAAYVAEKDPDKDKKVFPLDTLKSEINKNPGEPHYVVISVGGMIFEKTSCGSTLSNYSPMFRKYKSVICGLWMRYYKLASTLDLCSCFSIELMLHLETPITFTPFSVWSEGWLRRSISHAWR